MSFDQLLAGIAAAMHIIAFLVYNRQLLAGKNTPNISTWAIWAFLSLLNVASYQAMSGDWVKSLLPIISSLMCVATFLASLFKGRFVRIDRYDLAALALGFLAALAWWQFKSAAFANLIAQACIAIGFVPTFRSVWESPKNEKPSAWFLWSFAYVIGTAVVLMRWNNQYQDIIYYVDCVILHFIVAIMALRKEGEFFEY